MKRIPNWRGGLAAVWMMTGLAAATGWVAPSMAQEPTLRLPEYQTVKLENGLTLLLLERRQLPLVSLHWVLKSGGAIADPAGREGLASLTAGLLRKGARSRTAGQVAETLDFVGATFEAGAGLDCASGSCEFVKKDSAAMLDLVADLLLHPAFPAAELNKLAKQEIDGIKEEKAVPEQVIGRYYAGALFGSHPYGRPVGGTETSLARITRKDVARFYEERYAPNEMILAVVGDFSSAELVRRLRDLFGAWKPKSVPAVRLDPTAAVTGRHALIIDKPDATQTFFHFGNLGLAYTNQDRVEVEVVNTLFGGRFTSMINTELRIQSGLTYGASSRFSPLRVPGAFTISSFTPNASTERAMTLALETLKRLHDQGITADQLKSAKAYLKGLFPPRFETNDQLAATLAELELYGLDRKFIDGWFGRIDALTLADARRIIDQYYPLENLEFVFIGQAAVIEPVAKKLAGDVRKQAIEAPGF